MDRFKLYFLIYSFFLHLSFAQLSDKRLCIDEECSKPISQGKTLIRYFAKESYYLSFAPNQDVTIYSKSAGSNENLWGAKINGKRGYVPKNSIREMKIFGKPTKLVDTESINSNNNSDSQHQVPVLKEEEILKPSKVKENFEVIDGTTIHIQPELESVDKKDENTREESEKEGPIGDTNVNEGKTKNVKVEDEKQDNNVESGEVDDADDESDSSGGGIFDGMKNSVKSVFGLITDSDVIEENESKDNQNNDEKIVSVTTEKNLDSSDKIESSLNIMPKVNNELNENKDKVSENLDSIVANEEKPKTEVNEQENKIKNENISEERVLDLGKVEGSEIIDNSSISETKIEETVKVTQKPEEKIEKEEDKSEKISNVPNEIKNESNDKINLIEKISEVPKETNVTLEFTEENPSDIKKFEVKIEGNELSKVTESEILRKTENITGENSGNEQNETLSLDQNNNDLIQEKTDKPIENNEKLQVSDKEPSKIEDITIDPIKNVYVDELNAKNESTEEIDQNSQNSNVPPVVRTTPLNNNNNNNNNFINIIPTYPPLIKEEVITVPPVLESGEKTETKNENVDIPQVPVNDYLAKNSEENEKPKPFYPNEGSHFQKSTQENFPDSLQQVNDFDEKATIKKEDGGLLSKNDSSEEAPELEKSVSSFDSINDKKEEQSTEENLSEEERKVDENEVLEDKPVDGVPVAGNIFSLMGMGGSSISNNQGQQEGLERGEEEPKVPINEEIISENKIDNDEYFVDTLSAFSSMEIPDLSSDFLIYLVTTAVSVVLFLIGYFALEKNRREGPLIAKINRLEKELLIVMKEKDILIEEKEKGANNSVNTEEYLTLQGEYEKLWNEKETLTEQVQSLEKELENSTELGLELNRMLSEILSGENAGETLMANIEGLQGQLAEQQDIVSSMRESLSAKETENHELMLELDISNKKVAELQLELDKLLANIIKMEEEKECEEKSALVKINSLKSDIGVLEKNLECKEREFKSKLCDANEEIAKLRRNYQIKTKEYESLKVSLKNKGENSKNFDSLVETTSMKAELEQFKKECENYFEDLKKERENGEALEKRLRSREEEAVTLRRKLDEADKGRLESETKLQVLTGYFKEKEEQLQKEISKYESMWSTKQGEATSTSERIKYLQSEVQNYKTQNESLKQEIVSQEVELKSQISVLEKKVHENWVGARQAERRLEDVKQEAAQLRNRLTLRERALLEEKSHNRLKSPLDQTLELPLSPLHHLDPSPVSPSLLYGASSRDHMTKSPPMIGMPPPPFLPPPPGAPPPFLPPPVVPSHHHHHMPPPPFMPPPPHDVVMYGPSERNGGGGGRPPPLGRMSSPPLNSRYSPSDSRRSYSPYDDVGRSPSPSYDESEYATSPAHRVNRRYSPFSAGARKDRRGRIIGKLNGDDLSSGSNESLDEINRSKV